MDGGPVQSIRRVGRNAVALLLAYIIPRLLTVAGVVVAARVLGAARFGAYGTAGAYAVILSIVSTLGMMPFLIREMAREPERAPELMRTAHRVKTAASVVMLLLLLGGATLVLEYPPPVVGAALLLGAGYAVGAYGENLAAWFKARERMAVWTQASAVYGLVTGVLGIVLVVTTRSVVWFCVAPLAGQVASLAWLLRRAPPEVRWGRPSQTSSALPFLRSLLPFAAAFVVLTIYYKVDVLLLTQWRPPSDVGIYAAAYKFVDILHALALVGAVAVYPRLSRGAPEGASRDRWAGTRSVELALLAAVPVAGTLWHLRGPLIRALYGSSFAASAEVLAFLAPTVPALVVNLLGGYVLGAARKMDRVAYAYCGALVLNVGLNALLIPGAGAVGAGLAMLVSESVLALSILAILHREAAALPGVRCLAAVALAAAGFAAVALLPGISSEAALPTALRTGVSLAAAAGVYAGLRVISGEEWNAVRQAGESLLPRRTRR